MAAAAPSPSSFPQLFSALNASLSHLSDLSSKIPGSAIAWRYFKASHQDDPFRTLLELALVFFVIRTYAQSRTKGETSGKNFVKLSEKVSLRFFLYSFCCSSGILKEADLLQDCKVFETYLVVYFKAVCEAHLLSVNVLSELNNNATSLSPSLLFLIGN